MLLEQMSVNVLYDWIGFFVSLLLLIFNAKANVSDIELLSSLSLLAIVVLDTLEDIQNRLRNLDTVKRVEIAGSVRRMKETIGDADFW